MEVTFLIKQTGKVVTKLFESRYLGEKFVKKTSVFKEADARRL